VNNKSLEMLEFPRIRKILAGFTAFSASRELALHIQPLADYDTASLLLRHSAEAIHLLSMEPGFSIGGVIDTSEVAVAAARGKILEPQSLLEIQLSLAAVRLLRGKISKLIEEVPLLWDIASGITELRSVEKNIDRCLMTTGEVKDSASPKLGAVRNRLRGAHSQLLGRLKKVMSSTSGQRILQDDVITQREGRYVIPVKVELQKEIKGIIHDVSNTGATVFVEPYITVELGNELRELVMEEKREIEKILLYLSVEVGGYETEIRRNVELAARLDLALAKARYSYQYKATEPELIPFDEETKASLNNQAGVLKISGGRHPLLADKAVPFSVEIGSAFNTLVITGPNTGGKTVALKAIGLLSLMAKAGMPITAEEGSRIPFYDAIFADIGDEQSIDQTLSTFGWHVSNIVHIINHATRQSLVLLDELGTSTDPAEGSALARSILLHLLSRGTMTVATTHFSDLKAFAHTHTGFQNASLDFDPETLAPTYHLIIGVPGGSNALATASRDGLPPEIISDAKELLAKGSQELDSLIIDLAAERQKLNTIEEDVIQDKRNLEKQNTAVKNKFKALQEEERKILHEARDRVVNEAADLQREIRQATADLRKSKTREKIEQARKAMTAMQERMRSTTWQPATETEADSAAIEDERISVGDTIMVREANLKAVVLSISEGNRQIEAQAGQARLRISLDSVDKVASAPSPGPSIPLRRKEPAVTFVSSVLDLRGMRADEIEWELDRYLDSAVVSNLNEVSIIHGFGTGALRKVVRELLPSHRMAKSFRPGGQGEGGDGVTIVSL